MPIFFAEKMWEAFAKASLIFSTKNFSVFGYKVVKDLTSWPLNELVKLTMLWTTGPRTLSAYWLISWPDLMQIEIKSNTVVNLLSVVKISVLGSSSSQGEIFSTVNRFSLHTAFCYNLPIVLIWLKYYWKGRKIASHPSTHPNVKGCYNKKKVLLPSVFNLAPGMTEDL